VSAAATTEFDPKRLYDLYSPDPDDDLAVAKIPLAPADEMAGRLPAPVRHISAMQGVLFPNLEKVPMTFDPSHASAKAPVGHCLQPCYEVD
jgi:hypothetical protein